MPTSDVTESASSTVVEIPAKPSNHKWFRDLAISQIIVREMEAMGMQFPKPTVNLAEIRRKYHEAATSGKANRHEKR